MYSESFISIHFMFLLKINIFVITIISFTRIDSFSLIRKAYGYLEIYNWLQEKQFFSNNHCHLMDNLTFTRSAHILPITNK